MRRRYALCDDQWERIKDLLPRRAFPLLSHCRRTIGCGWKLCCTDIGQEFPGVTYRSRECAIAMRWGFLSPPDKPVISIPVAPSVSVDCWWKNSMVEC